MDIILASKSPRRKELLALMGYGFTVRVTEAPEPLPSPENSPEENLRVIVAAKSGGINEQYPESAVIAADTVVFLGGEYFGKPVDKQDAVRMLKKLSGKTHEVYTGVSVFYAGNTQFDFERSSVTFRGLSDREILDYVATGEPLDKAGAYGIQGFGAKLVARVDGDFYNVMGLPIGKLRAMLFNLLGD